jgi:hypothetical protein
MAVYISPKSNVCVEMCIKIPKSYCIVTRTCYKGSRWQRWVFVRWQVFVDLQTPDTLTVIKEGPHFANFFHVLYIPYVQTVVIVYTCQFFVVIVHYGCKSIWEFGTLWIAGQMTEKKRMLINL